MIGRKPLIVILFVVCLDQTIKVLVKINMALYQEIALVGDFISLYFTENNGFAFGLTISDLLKNIGLYISPSISKIILTLLSLVAVFGLAHVLKRFRDHKSPMPFFLALILGGAIGNIIDRVFYGIIFQPINLYRGELFEGRVVDMFLLNFSGLGMASPIVNIADIAITVGILVVLFFQGRFIRMHHHSLQGLQTDTP